MEMIERCGAALSKPSELARIIGLELEEIRLALLDPESEIYKAYFKGQELTKLELKEATVRIAIQGSSPAQTLAFALLKEVEMEMEEE